MPGEQGERGNRKELQRENMAQAKAENYRWLFGRHGNQLNVVKSFILKQPNPEVADMEKEPPDVFLYFIRLCPFYWKEANTLHQCCLLEI